MEKKIREAEAKLRAKAGGGAAVAVDEAGGAVVKASRPWWRFGF